MPAKQKSPLVLVVEDDEGVVRTIAHVLDSHGYDVVTTTHGLAAPYLFDSVAPDVVIADIIMSDDADEIDFIAGLHDRSAKTKIIAISGNPHLLRLASRHGAQFTLPKPFGAGQLLALLKTALT